MTRKGYVCVRFFMESETTNPAKFKSWYICNGSCVLLRFHFGFTSHLNSVSKLSDFRLSSENIRIPIRMSMQVGTDKTKISIKIGVMGTRFSSVVKDFRFQTSENHLELTVQEEKTMIWTTNNSCLRFEEKCWNLYKLVPMNPNLFKY